MRLNAYVSHDAERAETDVEYREGQNRFHSRLRDYGYKVIEKRIKRHIDPAGLPNRSIIFEFQIGEGTEKGKLRALDVNCITSIRT